MRKSNMTPEKKAELLSILIGGGTVIAIMIILILIVLTFHNCRSSVYKEPKAIVYREIISSTDTTEIWRERKYTLTKITIDTVPKNKRFFSTIEEHNRLEK